MPDPDDLGTYDGHTIDVGPVSCPACKRPYVSAPTLTEEEREAWSRTVFDALPWMEHEARCAAASDVTAAIIDRLSGSTSTGGPE